MLNSSASRSNGQPIVVVVGQTAFVYICQNVFDLHFANPHQIKITEWQIEDALDT